MYDSRTALSRQVADEVRQHFPQKVFNIIVPRSVRLSEAPSYGEPGIFYAPRSTGALAYRILTWSYCAATATRSTGRRRLRT
jgi:chromosome partitioning protein